MSIYNKQELSDVLADKASLIETVVQRLMRSRRVSGVLDFDDALSLAGEEAWVALGLYDESKGGLDAFLRHRVRYAVLVAARKARGAARRSGKKVSTEAGGGNTVEGLCVNDELDSKSVRAWRDGVGREQLAEGIRDALAGLSPVESEVVSLLKLGLTRPQVRKRLGLTRWYLREVLTQVRERLAPFAAGAGL